MANITLILIATFLALSNGFDDKFCKVERKPCTSRIVKKIQFVSCLKFQCNAKYRYQCTESICSTSIMERKQATLPLVHVITLKTLQE